MIGALIIDKPEGITSHDVVDRVRRVVRMKRVGHTGTLDPFATGVLVLCIGQATRLARFLTDLDKEYLATVRLGIATDTQDSTGKQIAPVTPSNEVSLERVSSVLTEFVGPRLQTPPMFSAKKVKGERLHRAARAGREVERQPVQIEVYSIGLTAGGEGVALNRRDDGTADFAIKVTCSSGTYVRTLAHDIGQRLSVGAHLVALRRTAVGRFLISNALTLDEVERQGPGEIESILVKPADMLRHLPALELDPGQADRVAHGRPFELTAAEADTLGGESAAVRLSDASGELVAIGKRDAGWMKPYVVLT